MKFISALVLFCLSFNVLADSKMVQELMNHMDEYQYTMTVDWDQKDKKFYEEKTTEFHSKLDALIEKGLGQEELEAALIQRIGDKKVVDALKLKLSLKDKFSTEELIQVINENNKEFYKEGASWSGEVIVGVSLSILLVGYIAYKFWWHSQHKCVEYQPVYTCLTDNSYSGGVYYTWCGYVDGCVRYEKK